MSYRFLPVVLALTLSACGGAGGLVWGSKPANEAPTPSKGAIKIGKPYKVAGKWYKPKEDDGYDKVGYASWYGPQFHGKPTANGERFDMNKVTAAHKTLPLPTYVRVTNLNNKRAIIVRVNDRGPFVGNRIIDLSRRSAQLLGFEKKGVQKVRVQRVEYKSGKYVLPGGKRTSRQARNIEIPMPVGNPVPTVAPASLPPAQNNLPAQTLADDVFVQIGAFSSQAGADSLVDKLGGVGPVMVQPVSIGGNILFRVRLGPFDDVRLAEKALTNVIDLGFSNARIFTDAVR